MSKTLQLKAGELTAQFDAETGFLRRIRFRGVEVLRGIYAAVRDQNWGTVEPTISGLEIVRSPDEFCIRFDAACRQCDIEFTWQGSIEGNASGEVVYGFDGTCHLTFLRNRIGFCVLHPPECAGLPCVVEHVNGTTTQEHFPDHISPDQPLMNLRSLQHRPSADLELTVRMEGETFEMEDQRNWTDASFKTYCTPLKLPFPVEVTKGTQIKQIVRLVVEDLAIVEPVGESQKVTSQVVALRASVNAPRCRLPAIGLGSSSSCHTLSTNQLNLLRILSPKHLRVDIELREPDSLATFSNAAEKARQLSAGLEVALFLSDDAEHELRRIAEILGTNQLPIARWLVFHVQEKSISAMWISLAKRVLPSKSPVFSGTNAYFAELNRDRPNPANLEGVCFSVNPQVHAFDEMSIMETPAMQAETVHSTRSFLSDVPIAITPVTLRPRFNPNATGPEPDSLTRKLSPQVDERQATCFAASWTLASLKYLCESGVDSITYYETVGQRGVMDSKTDAVYPLFHVLTDVCEWPDCEVIPCHSDDPLAAIGLILEQKGQQRILLGNLLDSPTSIQIELPDGNWSARRLNDATALLAATNPLEFRSNAAVRFEITESALKLSLSPYEVISLDLSDASR